MEVFEIKGGMLEYIDESHTYLYDGVILPSITQLLKKKFGSKYDGIPKATLEKASERGTAIHKAIEEYEIRGIETEYAELRNYKFLKKNYKFDCIGNEIPVVLFKDNEAIACGRLDLVIKEGDKLGLADIKTTATLDKNYLAYQLNLYRIAYQQCYGGKIEFLKGIHLKGDVRKYVDIPINEECVEELLEG